MKITKSELRKIIKEELIKESALEDMGFEPVEVYGTFRLIDVKLDNLKRATSFATPEEMLEDIADIRQAVEKLRVLVVGR
jgi:hypothetical protein